MPPRLTPAQLSSLAIYNPSLGLTDESFPQQLVFYYSRTAHEARLLAKKTNRNELAGGDAHKNEENEQLRKIGLAQGMVDFARGFTEGGEASVRWVETEKAREVLLEVERGWWIVASIDLTVIPGHILPTSTKERGGHGKTQAQTQTVEYSSREVSPPPLLLEQLRQAHYVFTLHHGTSLNDLYVRLSRDKFMNTLDRYWTKFARNWDVLIHGNPAADVFSALKLASGGELGFGVGEEEWGSGERDVLEDLVRRTEGMVDLVVSRFGDPDPPEGTDKAIIPESEAFPWMGSGNHPIATDGVIFSGVGAVTRPCLRDISLWIRQLYTYGEYAYGVRDNPSRERRRRRKRREEPDLSETANRKPTRTDDLRLRVQRNEASKRQGPDSQKRPVPPAEGRTTSQESINKAQEAQQMPTIPVGIPPPIVSAAEQSLNRATREADQTASQAQDETGESGTTLGIPDNYMKYLTFGLSTLGKSGGAKRPAAPSRTSTSKSKLSKHDKDKNAKASTEDTMSDMSHVDPMPDGEVALSKIAMQKHLETKGHFLIGLKGDLDDVQTEESALSEGDESSGSRNVLRTLQVELNPQQQPSQEDEKDALSTHSIPTTKHRRLRVLVYVRRPFIYCLLFETRAGSLSYSKFYRDLHHNLIPIHKPLLASTSVLQVSRRIEAAHLDPVSPSDTASVRSSGTANQLPNRTNDIFDLIYDPQTLTLHTSIPNVPVPGTPAAEGIITGRKQEAPANWTRVDALNVHSQILNTLAAVESRPGEIERMCKTVREWWVVWLRVPPTSVHVDDDRPSTARQQNGAAKSASSSTNLNQDFTITSSSSSSFPPRQNSNSSPRQPTEDDDDAAAAASSSSSSTSTIRHARQGSLPSRPRTLLAPIFHSPSYYLPMHNFRTAILVRKAADSSSPSASSNYRVSSPLPSSSPPSDGSGGGGGIFSAAMFGLTTFGVGAGRKGDTGSERGSSLGGDGGNGKEGRDGGGPMGGIGFDARRYVEGLLSLNR